MSANRALIDRTGDLKGLLLDYAMQPRWANEQADADDLYFGERDDLPEMSDVGNFLDYFLMQYRLSDGKRLIDHFVQDHPELPEAERRMILGFRDVREGVFLVIDKVGHDTLLALNLIDEQTYRINANMGIASLGPLPRGSFLVARVVPVEDEWVLSGYSSLLSRSQAEGALDLALQMAMRVPRLAFHNPELLRRAEERQAIDYQQFVDFFGGDEQVMSGSAIARQLRNWRHYQMNDVRGEDGMTVAERVHAQGEELPPLPEMEFDEEFLADPAVGMIYDPEEGLSFYRDFGLVAETFAHPELAKDRHHREAVELYLEHDSLTPLPLRRLAARNPDAATQVFRTVLHERDFHWERDAEAMFRRFKPWFFDRPVVPSIVVVDREGLKRRIEELSPPGLEFVGKTGRNDPCPCGSGKKYKRCCGA